MQIRRGADQSAKVRACRPMRLTCTAGPDIYGADRFVRGQVRTDLRVGGFSRSARIAIAFTSGPHAALAIIAVACSAVAIPLNPKHTLDEIERCFAVLRPDAVILLRDSDSVARRAAERNDLAIIEGIPAKQGTLGLKLDMPQARKLLLLSRTRRRPLLFFKLRAPRRNRSRSLSATAICWPQRRGFRLGSS
jgi:hypothetical protein